MSDYSKYLKSIPIGDNEVESIQSHNNNNQDLESSGNIGNQMKSKLTSVFSKVKGYVKLTNPESEQQRIERENSCLFKISQFCNIEKSYKAFLLFMILGIGITFFSFLFLPMAVLAPKKFVSLFSLGCTTTIFSFIFYYGTYDFLSILFDPSRKIYTVLFFVATIFGIYFSFFVKTFFVISLLCTIVQFIVVVIFTLSFIPGGKSGITFILNLIISPFKKLFASS